jgi:hypothetical protein
MAFPKKILYRKLYLWGKIVSTIIKPFLAGILLGSSALAQAATVYTITDVMSGSSGFNASLFHDATGPSAMSGATLATIPDISVISGTFDDSTGTLAATMSISTGSCCSLAVWLRITGTDRGISSQAAPGLMPYRGAARQ